ncbi:MAG: gliding motility-associated C-terminal domain-containing protein, partial [Bacteroidales bacterium]|nr:gliding motility-associated C-terminal domain-containing protein [Bacteroidales bacterium]
IVLNESDNSIVNHLINKPACGYLDNAATHGLNYDNNLGCYVPGRNMTSWTAFHESWEFFPNGNNYDITQITYEPEVIAPAGKISWEWYKGGYPDGELISDEKTVTVNPLENNTYTAVITLCGGETYTDDVHITVIPIPNAFRPTSNIGANREFRLMAEQHANIEKFRMQIYNRWGQLIFETDNVNKGWDGTYKGKACPMGLYVWIIYYEDDGEKITNKGNVTLLK